MWSASALLGLRCPLLLWYWSLVPHAGQCVMPIACALASTCFLNCRCSFVLVLLTVFLFLLFVCVCVCVRWWRVAASARRAPPPSNTTPYFLLSVPCFLPRFSFSSLSCGIGVCCVVRAQLCEHARNTTRALVFWVCLSCGVCCFYHNVVFVVPTTHCSLLTITVFTIEHCVPLITL